MRRVKFRYEKRSEGYFIYIPEGRTIVMKSERKASDYCIWLSKGVNRILIRLIEEYRELMNIRLDVLFMMNRYEESDLYGAFDVVIKQINWVLNHSFSDQGILFSCIEKIPNMLIECNTLLQFSIQNKSITFLNDKLKIRHESIVEIRNRIATMELEITRKAVMTRQNELRVVYLKEGV
ncbi:MAG: hypothetical protein KBA11_05865 [Sedimentibacter sp.]|nr:hypothetical protein [Sedimentibacter sp.]